MEDYIFKISVTVSGVNRNTVKQIRNEINDNIKGHTEDEIIDGSKYEVLKAGNVISLYISPVGRNEWSQGDLDDMMAFYVEPFLNTLFHGMLSIFSENRKMYPYEYLQSLSLKSSVNKDLLTSKISEESEQNWLYVTDWLLNVLPLYSNLGLSGNDMKEDITDEVMFTTQTVQEYLEEDDNNRILFTPVIREGQVVKRSWSVLQKDFLNDDKLLEAGKRYGCYKLDSLRRQNIDTQNTLVDLQTFGSYNMWVSEREFERLLEYDSNKPSAYAVIPSWRTYKSLVNADVLDEGANVVSRYHCQDTGRDVIKTHSIVPVYANIKPERKTCVSTDKIYRSEESGSCKPGFEFDHGGDNCCQLDSLDLTEQIVLLGAYRNVDFPPSLKYVQDIMSWYSMIRPIPSPWKKSIQLTIDASIDERDEGILEIVELLKPTIMNVEILLGHPRHIDKMLSFLNPIEHKQDVVIDIYHNMKSFDVVFDEYLVKKNCQIMKVSNTPYDDSIPGKITTLCKSLLEKENFKLVLEFSLKFEGDDDDEGTERDSFFSGIKEKIEEAMRRGGYKSDNVAGDEEEFSIQEPYYKDHVKVDVEHSDEDLSLWFDVRSKLPTPRKFK